MVLMFKGLEDNRGDWERELRSRVPDLEFRVWPDVGDVDAIDVALVWRPPRGDLMRYPTNHAFWRHPRIHVTPHIAGNTNPTSAASQVAENIRRARQGLTLLHEVDRAAGY